MSKVFFIAEAGVNHNGDRSSALELIDIAADAGADAIKFQTFTAKELVSMSAPKAEYQIKNDLADESHLKMLEKLELNKDLQIELSDHAKKKNIEFMSTAFDIDNLDFLVNEAGMKINKIPSGEITNAPLLIHHGRSSNKIILSTGMSGLEEIEMALSAIAFGMFNDHEKPSLKAFKETYNSNKRRARLKERVALLHCTSEYPAPIEDLNLRAIQTLSDYFQVSVGYSDHSLGIDASIIAVTLGAEIIEKHFTLDKNQEGPDHQASLEPKELKRLISSIRGVESILGSNKKAPTINEEKNKIVSRRSLVAKREIRQGNIFSMDNLTNKRPGNGISPFELWTYIGKKSKNNYNKDDQINE